MIQIYRQTQEYGLLTNELYVYGNTTSYGIACNIVKGIDNTSVSLSGTCTVGAGNRLAITLTDIWDAKTYGTKFKITSSVASNREKAYLGLRYTLDGEYKYQTFNDGETEHEFVLPKGATEIRLYCYISNQKTVSQVSTIKIYHMEDIPDESGDFDFNGDMTIFPISCVMRAKLNDVWELEFKHPLDAEDRWKYIENGAIIKAPSFNGDQLFRIKKSNKTDSGITATAEPIFMDALDDCFLVDVRPTDKTGQEALDIMTAPNSKYSGQSDITRVSTAYYQTKNLIEAINGADDNSFVNRWGGEILFDNFKVIINGRIGGDYGVQVLYGKNIKKNGVQEDIDDRDVVTRIVPKSYNGYMLDGVEPWVDSPIIGKYPTVHTRVIVYEGVKLAEDASEDDEENGIIVCDTLEELRQALIEKCEEEFEGGIDKPKVSLSVDMVLLQNTQEYANYQMLESVSLGDTVHCKHSKLGIEADARVIELNYDCILKKAISVKLGDFAYNYFDDVQSTVSSLSNRVDGAIRPDSTVMADKVAGILDAIKTQLRYQKNVAQRQDVRAILFEDLDPTSPVYGALSIGTQGFQIADSRTTDGKDWDWKTAFTAKGGYADTMILGVLSDQSGKSFWDLVRGIVQLQGTFRAYREDGSYTEMSADGLLNVNGSTKEEYLFMTYTGTVTITDFDNNSFEGIKTITLPTKFKGKKIVFVPSTQGIVLKGDRLSDPYYGALSKLAMRHTVNTANNTVELTVECRAFYIQHETADGIVYPNEYGTPTSVTVSYIVIA